MFEYISAVNETLIARLLSPIIVLQLLGMVYKFELNQKDISDKKRAIKVSFTADMYSNIQNLENEYKLMCRKKGNEK